MTPTLPVEAPEGRWAKLQADLAAMDKRAQEPESVDFAEPSPPVEYPRCRHCGRAMLFAVCPLPECSGKDATAKYDRWSHEEMGGM